MVLYYIRHGQPIYDPDSLTPLGERQAEALAKHLCRDGLDEIFASSSNRAILTAKPTCDTLQKKPTILDWCNENYAYNDLAVPDKNGRVDWCSCIPEYAALFTSPEMAALGENWATHEAIKATTIGAGIERIKRETYAFLSELGFTYDEKKGMYRVSAHDHKRVALFAHYGFGIAFLSCVLSIPYPSFCTRFTLSHSGVTAIHFPEGGEYVVPCVSALSNNAHLICEGVPVTH